MVVVDEVGIVVVEIGKQVVVVPMIVGIEIVGVMMVVDRG
jgi:hypothetical protein